MFDPTSLKARKQVLGLLINPWGLTCLGILTFQQILEASSTIWLVKLMETVTSGGDFLPYILLYLTFLALPYIPGCIALIVKTHWKQEAQRHFINAFVSSNRNNITEWNNKAIKEEKLSILTAEGPAALQALIDYVWDLSGYVLSVLFNILALAIVVEPLFALAYIVSVICVIGIMKWRRKTQRQLTQKALTARVELSQQLLAAWDNVLLGNDYNFKLWGEKTTQRMKRCLQRNVELERFDQVLAIFVALITAIPSLIVVVFSAIQFANDPVKLSAFIVILPLLFQILSFTYQTLSLAFRWGMHKSKLMAIYRSIQASKESHSALEKKINWPKIIANHQSTAVDDNHVSLAYPRPVLSHNDLLSLSQRKGRLTLRGENGCGKSTALILIKNALGGKAFLLPTHNQLSFYSETNKHSTGESLRKRLQEIVEKVNVDVLLLDEWDANLDKENQELLSALIDQLAEKKCVIEVRHR